MAALALPVISAGVNLLGGLFGANSAKKAANQVKQGSQVVANDIGRATGAANQGLSEAAGAAGANLSQAVSSGQISADEARARAIQNVGQATGQANAGLQGQLDTTTGRLSSFYGLGNQGAAAYSNLLNNPLGQYALPGAEEVRNTPGYQFNQSEGIKGLGQSAAAAGALETGGTAKALLKYSQNLADTYYQNAVQNSLGAYGANLQGRQQNINAATGAVNTGLYAAGLYNQASLPLTQAIAGNTLNQGYYQGNTDIANSQYKTGLGIGGAGQANAYSLGAAGQEATNTINSSLNAGNIRMQGYGAQAAGTIGATNAWTGAANNAGNSLMQAYYARPGANPWTAANMPPSGVVDQNGSLVGNPWTVKAY